MNVHDDLLDDEITTADEIVGDNLNPNSARKTNNEGNSNSSKSAFSKDSRHEEEYLDGNVVKVGITIPSNEYTKENIEKVKDIFLRKHYVKFCSEQFKGEVIEYNVSEVFVVPEATSAIVDEAIGDNYELNNKKNNPQAISIVLDIGGGTTDFSAMQGIDILPSSERKFNMGTNDAFIDIGNALEEKFVLENGYLDVGYVGAIIRYSSAFCSSCGNIHGDVGPCECGGNIEMKKNIFKLGNKGFDISDIVNGVFEEKANLFAEFFKKYIDTMFRNSGINKTQLSDVLIVGGGAEIYGKLIKERIESSVGEYVEIVKCQKAIWKTVNGLGKYCVFKDKSNKNLSDKAKYVLIDVGNASTKAKILGPDGSQLGKPIEMITKYATPVKRALISLKKPNPMMDLEVDIETEGDEPVVGDGNYYVSYLANKGKNAKTRNYNMKKVDNDITYIMAKSAIAVLIARTSK